MILRNKYLSEVKKICFCRNKDTFNWLYFRKTIQFMTRTAKPKYFDCLMYQPFHVP